MSHSNHCSDGRLVRKYWGFTREAESAAASEPGLQLVAGQTAKTTQASLQPLRRWAQLQRRQRIRNSQMFWSSTRHRNSHAGSTEPRGLDKGKAILATPAPA